MLVPKTIQRLVSDKRGFTLIEVLVAMLTSVVVTGALFAILEVSVHQSSRITDVAQADQLGRTTMTKVVNELHSACIAPHFAPVQANSSPIELRFINAYTSEAAISSTTAYLHQIVWNSTAKTLTEYRYASIGGESPEFKFPELDYSSTTHEAKNAISAKGILLGSNITQSEESGTGKKLPIFQYYQYSGESSSTSTSGLSTLELSGTEVLTAAMAAEVASVLISFNTAPTDGNTKLGRSADFSNQVTFAFSAPNSEIPILDSPCE